MVDTIDEQKSETPNFQSYLDIVRRRHLHFLLPLFAGWLVVWGSSWVLQPRYKSSTLILVEEPTMPKNYVEPNVSDNLQDRLQSITQQILSRTRLLTVIDNLHLYQGKGRALTPDERVELMRKDINIELVRDERNNEITAFRINYLSRSASVAQQVTKQLTELFIGENLRVRQQQSQGTTEFLSHQLEDARAHLAEQEAKVRTFESSHIGALPSQQASNLQILSGLQSQLQNEQDALNAARQQRIYLQSLLQQSREARSAAASVSVSNASSNGNSSELTAIDNELARLRSQMADLSSRYTDRYPDVLKLKEQIAKTVKMRNEIAASSRGRGAEPGGSSEAGSAVSQLQSNLHANQLEIANREQSIASLKGRINEYQGRLNEEPSTEQQLAELTRGYDQSKANYDDLLKKMNASSMATSMEQMQQGERFTVLDPPSLPVKPDFPNPLKFCGIGLGVGLALGILVAGGFEFLDHRIYSDDAIKAMLPMAVISEIPDVVLPSDLSHQRTMRWLSWTATGAVVVVILAGVAVSYLRG